MTVRPLASAVMVVLMAVALPAAPPYDFSAADTLLASELGNLNGHVAVIVRQNGTELYRFQAGDIDVDTRTRLASFTKTISAGVILSLVDDGLLTLGERIGDSFPLFDSRGLGDPTVLDCWAMRHGIETTVEYEHDARFTLEESVNRIGLFGTLAFEPGTHLGYDGAGMQVVGRLAEIRTGQSWGEVARERVLDPCDMPDADYRQFDPNPAVAGGLRSSAEETIRYAQMVLDGGVYGGERVLSVSAIERLFTNATRDLPVYYSPWPVSHPLYPYGIDPDYAFGGWVLAEHPETHHVEEIVGAGAWGSYIWIDRRRGLTAVLITDVTPGSRASMDAALGLCDIARRQVEAAQVRDLTARTADVGILLSWDPAPGSASTRVYGSNAPVRDIFDLRDTDFLSESESGEAVVPPYPYYAATAVFEDLENVALVPGENTLRGPQTPRRMTGRR